MGGPLSSLGWWNLISLKIGRRCFEAKTNVPSAGTTGGGGGGGQSGWRRGIWCDESAGRATWRHSVEEDGWCAAWCPRKISPKIVRGLGLAFRRKLKIQRVEGNFRGRGGVRARNKEESEKEEEEEEETEGGTTRGRMDKGVRRRKGWRDEER